MSTVVETTQERIMTVEEMMAEATPGFTAEMALAGHGGKAFIPVNDGGVLVEIYSSGHAGIIGYSAGMEFYCYRYFNIRATKAFQVCTGVFLQALIAWRDGK